MFGRLKKKQRNAEYDDKEESSGPATRVAEEEQQGGSDDPGNSRGLPHSRGDDPDGQYNSSQAGKIQASYLMGGSGVSLDGRSLVVPNDREFPDDISSINTAQYGYPNDLKITGAVTQDTDLENNEVPMDEQMEDVIKNMKKETAYEYHSARPPKLDEKTMNTAESYEPGCLPMWITDAPKWLKIVIVLSTAMLVGAIVLIGVGAALAVQKNDGVQTETATAGVPAPTRAPVDAPVTTRPGTTPIGDDEPLAEFPTSGSDGGVFSPTSAPNAAPTVPNPAAPPTVAPTAGPTLSTVTFYATGGRFTGDGLTALPDELASLPQLDGNVVMFHLGDWNSPYATSCSEESYQANVNLYSKSSVPVYFVPGDNEYNDCPDPEQAFAFWHEYLIDFETQFWSAPQWNVSRQEPDHSENYAYVYNGILFVGINLVGGQVHNTREWQTRHAADLTWIEEQYYLNEGDFEVMVVLAHADPDIQANDNFFETFYDRVQNEYTRQVIFIHRNLGVDSWGLVPKFNGIDNLMKVIVEGSVWPPMLIQIDTKAGTVDIDQGQWYDEYIASLST